VLVDRVTLIGRIRFEPENRTKKHNEQASWKKVAMVEFRDDTCEYYSWFIKKRYNISLNKPLRGPHISFINDSIRDLSLSGTRTHKEVNKLWEETKKKWHNKQIPVVLDLDPRSNNVHWWFNIPSGEGRILHEIRSELGLKEPFFKFHMTIGLIHPHELEHSQYILNGLISGMII